MSSNICPECNQKYIDTVWDWCKPCNSKHFQNDFNNWTSGNDKIDKFIRDAQLNADISWKVIEWIPYDRFKDVKQIGKGGFGTIYHAMWIDGYIDKWDIENKQWKRYPKGKYVALKKFDNFVNFNDVLNEITIHLKTNTKRNATIQFYGITQDPETHSYMMVLDYAADGNLREYLKINFNNINWKQKLYNLYRLSSYKFIRDAQLNADISWKVIEWIPYDRFKDVKQIGKGGFGTIYHAMWIDGYIDKWDIENKQWKRYPKGKYVALKKFDNFVNFNDVLNEITIHLKTNTKRNATIQFYGITQDPETHSYMMVLDYAADGNLREYLKINFNNINWKQKLYNLYRLSSCLTEIHELDIVHQDFHPGNILSPNFAISMKISDFGLSKLIEVNPNNPEKKNIFGVLPYIAPEVLSGDEEYTKAADIYSFGIIAYEIVTGFPPYPDIPHDKDLARQICNGLRPKIPFHTPKLITKMIMRCWDARVTHRPTFKELFDELKKYYDDYDNNNNSEIRIQIENSEKLSKNLRLKNSTTTTPLNYQTHPQAIYTSRLLNFSKLPKPKNEEKFERELEELTKSTSTLSIVASKLHETIITEKKSKIKNIPGISKYFYWEWPIEVPLAGYIKAKSLPYIGSWIQFSPAVISNLCNDSIEQPQPMVSTHTQEFSKWTMPMPHLNVIRQTPLIDGVAISETFQILPIEIGCFNMIISLLPLQYFGFGPVNSPSFSIL
ncbi:hypothetical protein Glove_33g159 [Diversispora epigaea]|uniref:Protein kinase domain-containing protein n=1 Tax=Diversispora epigaea TaxID=1348612 RepID=A0A397JGX0_9GLOM|nr:hypothetical protein Glove_33g159 [Diversispora epigaea]